MKPSSPLSSPLSYMHCGIKPIQIMKILFKKKKKKKTEAEATDNKGN